MEQVKTINHLGQVVYQESVEFYKEKLSVYSKDFLQNSLIPQLYEWSNAYKAAVELTKQKSPAWHAEQVGNSPKLLLKLYHECLEI